LALLALALWLAGRELGLRPRLLLWTVFGSALLRPVWFEHSGVGTLKNDTLHGAGFVLLVLVILRAVQKRLLVTDLVLLAFGATFVSLKYNGVFLAGFAVAAVAILQWRSLRRNTLVAAVLVFAFFLLTSGHYYLRTVMQYGNPFYPFQINIGLIHLPGTADLSNTSILYSLNDMRLWQAFFLPVGGLSPMGVLFPAILTLSLIAGACGLIRAVLSMAAARLKGAPATLRTIDCAAVAILLGWLLYFRSYYSASGSPGDLAYVLNSLNSVRYVEGVIGLSEIVLVILTAGFSWLVVPLLVINTASRLYILYRVIPVELFPPLVTAAAVAVMLLLFLGLAFLDVRRRSIAFAATVMCLLAGGPFLVERSRRMWTTHWNDLKPTLQSVPASDLLVIAFTDAGWFAGHVVAAGNPVRVGVRALLGSELPPSPDSTRPRYAAILVDSGSEAAADWRTRYGTQFSAWGYALKVEGRFGALLERTDALASRPPSHAP
jgi:hypothetical protein